jgi:hypothetical protein
MKSAGHNKGCKVNSSFIRIGQLQPPTNKMPNGISEISQISQRVILSTDLNIYNFHLKHNSIW